MTRNTSLTGLLSVLLLASGTAKDGSAQRVSGSVVDKLRQDPVVLKVSVVKEESNTVVPDLREDSFIIEENGERQKATAFSRESRPISLVLLIDSSGSMRPVIQLIVEALSRAVKRLNPDDEVALMSFNNRAELYQ